MKDMSSMDPMFSQREDELKTFSLADLVRQHHITPHDLKSIHQYGEVIIPHLCDFVDRFYVWLETTEEYAFFSNDERKLRRVQSAQEMYWRQFFNAELSEDYLESRRKIGEVHSHIGLSLPAYFSALNFSQDLLLFELYPGGLSAEELTDARRAVNKLIHLDASLIVEAYARLTNKRLSEQAQALMEMSTPVTSLWDHILMLPVVGIIDSRRAQNMMSSVLHRIAETRAKVFIIDIGGVSVVDTAVANHLIKITQAARLMGCVCLLSGVSPAIAQTTVELGIDVGNVLTRATMRDALEEAFRLIKVEVSVSGG